ncbi:PfkB family carbohydrate kinase [Arachis hypogaea]|nr:PfkB family carbohydrate kinase [Arachis hypogaea]
MHRSFSRHLWLVLRYAILNLEVIQAAISLAKQEGLLVSLDLASFEMVRKFKPPLMKLLESGNIDLFDSAVNCLLLCIDHLENMTNYTIMKASVLIALAMAAGTGGFTASSTFEKLLTFVGVVPPQTPPQQLKTQTNAKRENKA